MKIALLGDLHIGIKQDDEWTVKNQKLFFQFFFDKCKEMGVSATIQTGDWFDVRRGISQETLQFIREDLVPNFQSIGETYVLVGNHDMHKRETITPNSCREVLSHYKKFNIIEEPTALRFDNVEVDMIPWICKENSNAVYDYISKSNSPYCVGHFELSGFYYYTGLKSDGTQSGFLSNYEQVWSGHFHCQSSNGNIQYIGTPYTLTLGDANDSRGFYVFDTETRKTEYIENPNCWHKKIYFDAATFQFKQIKPLAGCAVRIVVERRSCPEQTIDFDVIAERISNTVHSLDILDSNEFIMEDDSEVIEVADTKSFVDSYIESLTESDEIKEKCKIMFAALQREAVDLE